MKKIKEMKMPSGWNEMDSNNYKFASALENAGTVSREKFMDYVDLNDSVGFNTYDKIEDWLDFAERGDLKYQLAIYNGHIVGCVRNMGYPYYFTPSGVTPGNLPDITNTPDKLVKYVNEEAFKVDVDTLAGKLVAHGTNLNGLNSIKENGIQEEFMITGNLGKCFYVTRNYQLSLFNYASNMDVSVDKSESGVVLLQIKPDANIVEEDNPVFDENMDKMGSPDFADLMMKNGIDGVLMRAFDAIAIYNPSVLKVHNTFLTKDILPIHKKNELNSDLSL